MSASQDSPQHRTVKAKKAIAHSPQPPFNNPSPSGPTTFFLRSEKDIDIPPAQQQRGRKASRDSNSMFADDMAKTPMPESMYGVQSLEETISTSFTAASPNLLARIDSNASDASTDISANDPTSTLPPSRKRKAGNPVHPRIAATGQRILSAEHFSTAQAAAGAGPARSNSPLSLDSPIRSRSGLRRGSASSSVASNLNLSQSLTPWKMSPQPESAMPSTPRSGSPKSFRLSDEEISVAGSNNSQAVQSSSEEEDVDGESAGGGGTAAGMPQLVMPHIAMPSRRPFTERGRGMGRLKVMVVGPRGVGKTSLIQCLCRACEDVVYLDNVDALASSSSKFVCETAGAGTTTLREIGASTRPYPAWWTDFENRRQLLKPKKVGEGVLERNITFIDTPGFHDGHHIQQTLNYFKQAFVRMSRMERMNDSELIGMLSGEGGVQVDAVIYVFKPGHVVDTTPEMGQEVELLQYLCKWTNVIPVIGRADESDVEGVVEHKRALLRMFKAMEIEPFLNNGEERPSTDEEDPSEPFAISCALADDSETIDASVLMASSYLQPLISSDLSAFVTNLFDPTTTARLRHLSAVKFLLWRQQNLGSHLDLQKQLHSNHHSRPRSPSGITSTTASDRLALSSFGADPEADMSRVLVPHGSSSYFRSLSPTASDTSSLPITNNTNNTNNNATTTILSRAVNTASPTEPFRQIRLAKWAQDLQRSLHNEGRRRYQQLYNPSNPLTSAETSDPSSTENPYALSLSSPTHPHLPTYNAPSEKHPGHLGGPLSVIDPRDPLGLLAFSQAFRRRGAVALRVAGGCGVVGMVAWWVLRHWSEVVAFFGVGGQEEVVRVRALGPPVPTAGVGGGLLWDLGGWREWAGV